MSEEDKPEAALGVSEGKYTIPRANSALFQRYAGIIERHMGEPDPLANHERLSLENLAWMCQEGIREQESLPEDKLSRWLGFIQGCLCMREMINVDTEREISRPLFHRAYEDSGRAPPPRKEKPSVMDSPTKQDRERLRRQVPGGSFLDDFHCEIRKDE